MKKKYDIPLCHKSNLTIDEAAIYTGINRYKLYEMTSQVDCPFVLWNGKRRLIKREAFNDYIKDLEVKNDPKKEEQKQWKALLELIEKESQNMTYLCGKKPISVLKKLESILESEELNFMK